MYLLTCVQRRLQSDCASAQSDWSLRCPHVETLHPWLYPKMCPLKILIRLRICSGWSESAMGAHVRSYVFSRCGSFIACNLDSSRCLELRVNWQCSRRRKRHGFLLISFAKKFWFRSIPLFCCFFFFVLHFIHLRPAFSGRIWMVKILVSQRSTIWKGIFLLWCIARTSSSNSVINTPEHYGHGSVRTPEHSTKMAL